MTMIDRGRQVLGPSAQDRIYRPAKFDTSTCPTDGCNGDRRYAAPGRGHREGCHYPTGFDSYAWPEPKHRADVEPETAVAQCCGQVVCCPTCNEPVQA